MRADQSKLCNNSFASLFSFSLMHFFFISRANFMKIKISIITFAFCLSWIFWVRNCSNVKIQSWWLSFTAGKRMYEAWWPTRCWSFWKGSEFSYPTNSSPSKHIWWEKKIFVRKILHFKVIKRKRWILNELSVFNLCLLHHLFYGTLEGWSGALKTLLCPIVIDYYLNIMQNILKERKKQMNKIFDNCSQRYLFVITISSSCFIWDLWKASISCRS